MLDVGDFGSDDGMDRVFPDAFSFIGDAIDSGGAVFVHCANGSNRSPTLLACYLLFSARAKSLKKAWQLVLARRPGISPLKDNLLVAAAYEVSLKDLDESSASPVEFSKLRRRANKKLKQRRAITGDDA